MSRIDDLLSAADQAVTNTQLLSQVVTGDNSTIVDMGNGVRVKSLSRIVKEAREELSRIGSTGGPSNTGQAYIGGKEAPISYYAYSRPRAIIFMFSYLNIFDTQTPNAPNNAGDPNFWFRRAIEAIKGNPHVEWIVVINPDSGPGAARDGQFTDGIEWLHGAGATVLGYMDTDWGGPFDPDDIQGGSGTGPDAGGEFYDPLEDTQAYKDVMDRWIEFYPDIDGFWLDEVPFYTRNGQDGAPNDEAEDAFIFYKDLYDYAKDVLGVANVGGNPGQAQFDDRYFREKAMDFQTIFEQEYEPGADELAGDYTFGENLNNVRRSQKGIMVHNIGRIAPDEVARRIVKNSQWVDIQFYWEDDAYGNGIAWNSDQYEYWINAVGLGFKWLLNGGVQAGTTAQRPDSPGLGDRYFDADLNQPIYWNGGQWVDSTGSAV